MPDILTNIAPEVWVAIIGLPTTLIGLWLKRKKEKAEARKSLEEVARKMIDDNFARLQEDNKALSKQVEALKDQEGDDDTHIQKLRFDILQLQGKIATVRSMLVGLVMFAESLPSMYRNLTEDEFIAILEEHHESIQSIIREIEDL